MKYDITQEDKHIMERDMKCDRALKHIRNLSFYKFTIGDVLIREDKFHNYKDGTTEWKVRLDSSNLPYKYVYVFENELGIGYIRRLSVNGRKFVETPVCVTQFDPDDTRFTLDPAYADHILLASEDEEFDTKSRYAEVKKKREQVNRKNKKIAVPMADEAAVLAWMNTLKVGDQLWYGYSIGNIEDKPYFVHEVVATQPLDWKPAFSYYGVKDEFKPYIKMAQHAPNTTPTGYSYVNQMYVSNLLRRYVFNQRPTFFEEIIN